MVSKSRRHSIKTHFPKDRDCDIFLRTKIKRAPCRKRTGAALLRAEKFGDLMTADHQILNEGFGSRDNHRYAVVAQDLATQWIQSYPCKTKTSHETEKSLRKFLDPWKKTKVINTDNSQSCEDLTQAEEKNKEIFWENQTGLHQHHFKTHRRMMVKQEMISGPFQGTTFTVITLNRESNCTCRENHHSQFHYDTLTWPERQVRPWMWCVNAA